MKYLIHHLLPLKHNLNYISVTLFKNYRLIEGSSSEIPLFFTNQIFII